MGRVIRIGLVLAAAACLVAVLADWVIEELNGEATQAGIEAEPPSEADPVGVEAAPDEATAESHDQG